MIYSKYLVKIFTGDSKSNYSVDSAAVPMIIEKDEKPEKTQHSSIFPAETKAIDLTVDMINKNSEQSFLT